MSIAPRPGRLARGGARLREALGDRHPRGLLILIVALLAQSLVDGVLTLVMVGGDIVEINPAMGYLLDRGPVDFLVGKYCLTAAGLPLVLAFKDHRMFGSRFRVGYLLPVFVGLYLVLLSYQVGLLWLGPEPGHRARADGGSPMGGRRP